MTPAMVGVAGLGLFGLERGPERLRFGPCAWWERLRSGACISWDRTRSEACTSGNVARAGS